MTPPEPIAPRQTISHIQRLLATHGIRPKNKLGQCFLIDLNLIDLIVRTAELTRDDLVLEVGAGTGSLTARLAESAGAVVSFEIDSSVHALALEQLGERPNVRLIQSDALRNKNELHPRLVEALDAAKAKFGTTKLKLVSNLPYAVATPVIANLLIAERPIERMIVTVQWEIAERLLAQPRTSQFSALSVLVQSLADVALVRKLAPSVFWPRPKVESAIVQIDPKPAKRAPIGEVVRFRNFLRDLYTHRRKNLRGALSGWPTGRREKADVDAILERLELPGTMRAEELTIEQHQNLWRAFEQLN